jgi:hypothetical protein
MVHTITHPPLLPIPPITHPPITHPPITHPIYPPITHPPITHPIPLLPTPLSPYYPPPYPPITHPPKCSCLLFQAPKLCKLCTEPPLCGVIIVTAYSCVHAVHFATNNVIYWYGCSKPAGLHDPDTHTPTDM